MLLLPMAEARSKAGDVSGALDAAKEVYERYVEAFGADSETTRSAALWIARWLNSAFRFQDAEAYFERAMLSVGGAADTVDPITLAAMIDRVALYVSEGQLANAERQLRNTEPKLGRIASDDGTLRRLFTRQLAQILVLRGSFDEAIRYLTPQPGSEPQQIDRLQSRLLAWALGKSGETDQADVMFAKLLEDERQNPGTPFREIFARLYYADVLLEQGRAKEAASQASLAITKYDAFGFQNDPDRLWGLAMAGAAYVELGQLDEAGLALTQASQIQTLFPEHKLHVPTVLWAQARYEHALVNTDRAKVLVSEAIMRALEIYGPDHATPRAMQMWRDSL